MKTGWPPGLLQDDDRWLSKWFVSKPDARRLVRERCKEIEREHMTQHAELIERLRCFDRVSCTQAADALEAQEAEIARLNKAKEHAELMLEVSCNLKALEQLNKDAACWNALACPDEETLVDAMEVSCANRPSVDDESYVLNILRVFTKAAQAKGFT